MGTTQGGGWMSLWTNVRSKKRNNSSAFALSSQSRLLW